jgi:glutamine amidotransferase PdxT
MKKIVPLMLAMSLSLPFASAMAVERNGLTPMTDDSGTYMKVSGVISQVRSGLVFVKTPWGQRTVASNNGLTGAQVGDEIIMLVDKNNMVIAVHKK